MLLLLAVAPVLAMPAAPVAAAIKPAASEQELLVIKKKKAEAARKTYAAKKLAAKKAAEAKRIAAQKRVRLIKSSSTIQSRAVSVQRRKVAANRNCAGFLSCLFGKKTGRNVQHASLARTSTGGGRDVATSEVVSWSPGAKYSPGTLVVRTPERALYLVLGNGEARRYSVGVGREGFQWSGNSRISAKAEWPTWRPPQVMIEREAAKGHFLPTEMEGGPENPLGARALYIGGTMFRIHGTNNASSIGGAVSSGCIRMMNSDVIDLYGRVKVGARVYVYQ